MRTIFFIMAIIGCVGLIGCQPKSEDSSQKKKSKAAPVEVISADAELTNIDGSGSTKLADFRGNEVILYFMASWTDSAAASFSVISDLRAAGYKVLVVYLDATGFPGDASAELDASDSYTASEELVKSVGGVRAVPTAILLDKAGGVVEKWPGFVKAELILADISSRNSP